MGRWGRSDRSVADDLIQDVLAKLFAQDRRVLRCFRGRDSASLQAYLRVIAARVTTDYYRGKEPPPRSLDDPHLSPSVIDNHASEQIERKLLLSRVEGCLEDQRERDRWVFWLYHRQGFTPQSISVLPGVSMGRSGVETLIYRLTKLVAECVKKSRIANEGLPA
jgi:RNA polymerase sigma factor (sigma-70 family)